MPQLIHRVQNSGSVSTEEWTEDWETISTGKTGLHFSSSHSCLGLGRAPAVELLTSSDKGFPVNNQFFMAPLSAPGYEPGESVLQPNVKPDPSPGKKLLDDLFKWEIDSDPNFSVRRISPHPSALGQTYPPSRPSETIGPQPVNTFQSIRLALAHIVKQSSTKLAKYGKFYYVVAINPLFSHKERVLWDVILLERHLDGLKTWVWSANAALSAAVGALLALTTIDEHAIPLTFLILSGIFSFFGFVYAMLLVHHVGTRTLDFKAKFCNRANSQQPRIDIWNASTMIFLPITWMHWSMISFFSFLVALGAEMFISDVRSLTNGQQDFTTQSTLTMRNVTPTLNLIQLALFTVVSLWSLIHIRMSYVEIHFERDLESGLHT